MAVWSVLNRSSLPATFRLDAEYYQPDYLAFERRTEKGDRLAKLVSAVMHPIEVTRIYSDRGLRILLAQNIRPNFLDLTVEVYMPERIKPVIARNLLKEGDVVMTRSGANFGDTACYLGAPTEIYACADCLILRPTGISPAYLSTFLNTKIGRGLLTRGAYGMAQPHIAPTYLRGLCIPRLGEMEDKVQQMVEKAGALRRDSIAIYQRAESDLNSALGLDWVNLAPRLFYEDRFANATAFDRFDAEYYQPAKRTVQEALAATRGRTLGEHFRPVRQLWQPNRQSPTCEVRNYDLNEALSPFLDDTTPTATAADIDSTKKGKNLLDNS
jgi:hypothetical protein